MSEGRNDRYLPTQPTGDRSIPTLGQDISISLEQTTVPPPAMKADPYIGKTIDGRYLIEQVLGEGGMGVVYRGRHKIIDKRVAIKVLRGEMSRDKEITERFLQEARAASSIGNPHIVDISDFGQLPDGSTYFVMEHLEGSSLSGLMDAARRAKPLGVPQIVHIAKQIAQGLGAAHDAGIVHRDLKPDNVMIINRGTDKDFVKILDFGIAKVGTGASRLTQAGSVFGTPHYMSPEQAAGTPVDNRTDIYSLGVMLYEMASGRVPFDADNFMGILTQHMYKSPPSMMALVPPPGDVPPGLDAIVLKCLSKKPDQRYASMAELVLDFEQLELGKVPAAVAEMMGRSGGFNVPADYFRSSSRTSRMPPPVPGEPYPRARSRTPLFAVMGGIAGSALVAIAVVVVSGNHSHAQTSVGDVLPIPNPQSTGAPSTSATLGTGAAASDPSQAIDVFTKQVLLMVEPSDAHVWRDGKDLGTPPMAVDMKTGETVILLARRPGYREQTITLNAKTPDKTVVKMVSASVGAPVPKIAKPPASLGTGAPPPDQTQKPPKSDRSDISDPWKK